MFNTFSVVALFKFILFSMLEVGEYPHTVLRRDVTNASCEAFSAAYVDSGALSAGGVAQSAAASVR